MMAPILAVRQWLQYVNDQVSPEGVEYLKLALHPFLVANYQEAERLMIPSKLYDFLLEKHFQDDVETTLRWFVHALSLLGGDLRGHRLVEHLHTYGISRPSDPENMTRDQRFFECLTKIGRKARGLKLEVKLIHSFSRSAVLNIHYKNVNGLPDIFVKLVRTQKVSTTDTDLLAATLRKYGAKQCLFYLNEYHKAVGMKEIPGMTNFSRGDFSPTTVYETTESSSDDGIVMGSRGKQVSVTDKSMETLLGKSCNEVSSEEDSDSEDDANHLIGSSTRRSRNKSWKSVIGRRSASCGVCVFISVAIILTAGCMFGKIWIHLIDVSKFEDVNVYEDVTVILGEVDRFYHWQLKITSVHVPLGQHHVDVYAHNSECSQLPTVSNNLYVKHISNSTEDYAHLYLPPESIIQYKISPVSSLNNVSTDIKGRAFITYGPEINLFTPRTCHGPLRSPDCKIFDQQSYNGTELFHTFKSHQRGYYNVHIRVNSEYMFHLNITSLAIDRNQTEHKCRIDQGNSSCYIDLSFDVSWRKVCLVAYTEHPSETDHQDFPLYTTLAMKVSGLWIQWVLLITLTPFVTFYVIILTVLAFWYCFHTMRSSHNPAFSKPVPLKLDI